MSTLQHYHMYIDFGFQDYPIHQFSTHTHTHTHIYIVTQRQEAPTGEE
uniref:Uncharacterized protein n=1 Tax=Anguilla anguilla TaxID=7936 RepID=A0A0E9VDK3_ANGAN